MDASVKCQPAQGQNRVDFLASSEQANEVATGTVHSEASGTGPETSVRTATSTVVPRRAIKSARLLLARNQMASSAPSFNSSVLA